MKQLAGKPKTKKLKNLNKNHPTTPAGVVQPHVQKGLLFLAEEEESSAMESLGVAVGGKEDDCYDYD